MASISIGLVFNNNTKPVLILSQHISAIWRTFSSLDIASTNVTHRNEMSTTCGKFCDALATTYSMVMRKFLFCCDTHLHVSIAEVCFHFQPECFVILFPTILILFPLNYFLTVQLISAIWALLIDFKLFLWTKQNKSSQITHCRIHPELSDYCDRKSFKHSDSIKSDRIVSNYR